MIKISVASYDNVVPSVPVSALFGRERKTIGRRNDNFLVLPDPAHEVSRFQAAVWSDNSGHFMINLSDATPIYINGQEFIAGNESAIRAGDRILIGRYLLEVQKVADEAGDGAEPQISTPDAAAAQPPRQPSAPAPAPAAEPPQVLPLELLATQVEHTLILSTDEVASLMAQAAPAAQAPPAAAPDPLEAAFVMPEAEPEPEPGPAHAGAAGARADGAPPESADLAALKAAFLRGARIPRDAISAEWTPELMELLGKLMAGSVQGAIDLLTLRSLVKQVVKADVTQVVVRNNNPLKFFPDSQTVLTQMLRKKMPGFMEPLEAIDDAYHDLRGHQMGVVAGTRASMDAMMQRLDPDKLDAGLEAPSALDGLMPSRRKAMLWDLYVQSYEAIAGDAQDNFKTLFGADFLAAYEKEVENFNDRAARRG
ncbi:type VI secretion system-associated FHA domain protein TagH [Massilia glaciei]|uniref:Type VI secretion system-associated FHA domain protein TagH n=1 Tax=Massilia glaciei TaxID=1524097 RepID=A0A2U2HP92_9BURK|nr:type VI secretion system-associated FHA domain protein TagH [Massilia glaciei]PWF49272.1 type VI secretion system-associated FHA domain protein TagH [Massilia glaciei]